MTRLLPYEAPLDGDPDTDDHESLGRPFRIVAKIKNNRLIRARLALGYATCADAARNMEVSLTTLCRYENLQENPWSASRGDWKDVAKKIAAAYAYHPGELWPDTLRKVEARTLTLEVSTTPRAYLPELPEGRRPIKSLSAQVDESLASLSPRQREVIEARFGIGHGAKSGDESSTFEEIGSSLNLSRERVRQLELRALRHLRQPAVAKALRPHAMEVEEIEKPVGDSTVTCPVCARMVVIAKHGLVSFENGKGFVSCSASRRAEAALTSDTPSTCPICSHTVVLKDHGLVSTDPRGRWWTSCATSRQAEITKAAQGAQGKTTRREPR